MNTRTEASTPPVFSKSVEKRYQSPTSLNNVWYDFLNRLKPQKAMAPLPINLQYTSKKQPRFLSPPAENLVSPKLKNEQRSLLQTPQKMPHYSSYLRLSTASDRKALSNVNTKLKPPPLFIREKKNYRNNDKPQASNKQSDNPLLIASTPDSLMDGLQSRLLVDFAFSSSRVKSCKDYSRKD